MGLSGGSTGTVKGTVDWKRALIAALVVLLVVIGLPVLMPGMGSATCADCGPAVMAGPSCILAAVLTGFALAIALVSRRLRIRRDVLFDLLRAMAFDRPPQLA